MYTFGSRVLSLPSGGVDISNLLWKQPQNAIYATWSAQVGISNQDLLLGQDDKDSVNVFVRAV